MLQFSYVLGVLLLVELGLCALAFIFSTYVRRKVVEILQTEALVHYRDDDDLRNLVDWTQHTVSVRLHHHRRRSRPLCLSNKNMGTSRRLSFRHSRPSPKNQRCQKVGKNTEMYTCHLPVAAMCHKSWGPRSRPPLSPFFNPPFYPFLPRTPHGGLDRARSPAAKHFDAIYTVKTALLNLLH